MIKRIIIWTGIVTLALGGAMYALSIPTVDEPETIQYGVSFSKLHSDELNLDWRETYDAILADLGVRHLRLSAHWPMVEPEKDAFNFTELDYQVREAREAGATVILGVGRRLPGWPECHIPDWADGLSAREQKDEIRELVRTVVNRYKDEPHISYWQVENEAFLLGFAKEQCGELDVDFLEEELDLVRDLDPETPILMTDGGEFGLWLPAYTRADAFGTTMYLYIWSKKYGRLRYPVKPGFFYLKHNIVRALGGEGKPMILIELGLEPWLTQPIVDTPVDTQLKQMGMDKFKETLSFAQKTRFDTQYLWGAEWWYWMKERHNDPRFWRHAQGLFRNEGE